MLPRSRPLVATIIGLWSAAAFVSASAPAAAEEPEFCYLTPGVSDFNGDGYDDAAVGDPYATVNGQAAAGSVTLLFGGADGRIGDGRRAVITQASFGDEPEAGDHFGWDVAMKAAGLGTDCADLLVGSPGEDVDGAVDAGIAHLIRDLPNDEGTPELEAFTLTQADAGGDVEPGDELGYTVAIGGQLQEDGYRLVVAAGLDGPAGARGGRNRHGVLVGAPGDTVAGRDGAGSVTWRGPGLGGSAGQSATERGPSGVTGRTGRSRSRGTRRGSGRGGRLRLRGARRGGSCR